MDEENILDFNFWPSFSDLMLSLVLILVLVLFLVAAVLNVGTINLSHVEKNQDKVIKKIASIFKTGTVKINKNLIGISSGSNNNYDIFIKNEPTLQKYTFSTNVLFGSDKIDLKERGREVLEMVGKILKDNISYIREIQIQGHADTNQTSTYKSNVHLAAFRAITVFNFLKEVIQIDPAKHLMSVTSFGEFKPVQRPENDAYDEEKLGIHNRTAKLRKINRRIELLIFYHF